jgi:hypothetical protein
MRIFTSPHRQKPNPIIERDIAKIPLTRGLWAIVDLVDLPLVKPYRWSANGGGYASAWDGERIILMHQIFLPPKNGFHTDHINGNKGDNRRVNLRYATRTQNSANHRLPSHNKTGHSGVCWDSTRKKWMVTITANRTTKRLGRYDDLGKAIAARQSAEDELFGRFRRRT